MLAVFEYYVFSDTYHLKRNSPGILFLLWPGIAQSVERLATGWSVRDSNPGGGEIFRTRPDRPRGPPRLLYNE